MNLINHEEVDGVYELTAVAAAHGVPFLRRGEDEVAVLEAARVLRRQVARQLQHPHSVLVTHRVSVQALWGGGGGKGSGSAS
jgi:hypothetical protein